MLAAGLTESGYDISFADYAGAAFPLFRNVRRHKAEALHIHWIADIQGAREPSFCRHLLKQFVFRLDVSVVSRFLGGRVIWTVHNLTSHEGRYPQADLAARRFLARRAAYLITHSAAAGQSVITTYRVSAERVTVIRHGSYIGNYPNNVTRGESRARMGIRPEQFVFLCLGILRPYKGVEELIEAFGQLADPRKCLIVAGHAADDTYLARLRKVAPAAGVRLDPSFVPDEELQVFFNAADAVVLPFRSVLTSGSLLMAMSFGRMIVAPRLGCIPDYADPDNNILYDPSDPQGLQTAMENAMQRDPEACGRHNLERAREFDWSHMATETARVYDKLFSH